MFNHLYYYWLCACTGPAGLVASFTRALELGTTPQTLLWLLPLAASVAVVYKATKLPEIHLRNFLKEVALLFLSITVFIVVSAVILLVVSWLLQ